MRTISKGLVALLVSALVSPALAGITVTEYRTVALTNAFAPLSQTQYFAEERLVNVSPALAEVSTDWMGPNAGGSTNTWHFVGTSQATSTTAFDAGSYTVTAAGSFTYKLNTTAEFEDPRSSGIYSPGGAANYRGFFEIDNPANYTILAQLNERGRVRLSSFEGLVVFDRFNLGPTPMLVNLTGTVPAGHYDLLMSTSLVAPNLPNGVNHFTASGNFEDVRFTVQVPEANSLVLAISTIGSTLRRRRRCAR